MDSVGAFLRSRRASIQPEGQRLATRRRTPGLRREEVAERAGLSVDWYTRLEQDRATAPSIEVLEAISGALQLNASERRYLFRLARGSDAPSRLRCPPVGPVGPVDRTQRAALVSPALRAALDAMREHPAIVFNPRHDILATNALGYALFLGFNQAEPFPMNGPWFVFCDARARELYPEYEKVARETVGSLRSAAAALRGDDHFPHLVRELSSRSPLFAELWASQYVSDKTSARKLFRHPQAGLLDFALHGLTANDGSDQQMLLYVPNDEPSRENLARLQAAVVGARGEP